MRVFLAIPIAEPNRQALNVLQEEAGAGLTGAKVAWVRNEGLHLTLNFFGEIDDGLVDAIHAAVNAVLPGKPPFELQLAGIGAFPNLKNPRVIWCGVLPQKKLIELHRALGDRFRNDDLPWEKRPLSPHITIGRVRFQKFEGAVMGVLEPHAAASFGGFTADRLVLYRSHLQPGGSVYEELWSERLPG